MNHSILILLLASSLVSAMFVGCSSLLPPPPEKGVKKVEVLPPKVPMREMGSLWSESSSWNSVFEVEPSHQVGDVILIKPNESFKKWLVDQLPKKEKLDEKGESVKQEAVLSENYMIATKIVEVMPRGSYSVLSEQQLKIGNKEFSVLLRGFVRARDINAEGILLSDYFFNAYLTIDEGNAMKLNRDKGKES